ncbi:hypothetical protein LEP1GSC185_0031 [Leptospira licerasiae serovar Varillal str. VAR 010]|uniref:Uncharacterized protein n=1 Tax=Leptospira licerasiae str. MMD4847 TaxID=1049971 RepID=A0ABP2RCE5_9LEPT|nr:hypothetical protein LEP1GSC185_0031 [Leptospira licerasiae serovar Varillal str. VAR 010]EJZ42210.1 hypothetical protein LEP1GSC178_2386 [Leptospira licerasiae str. MMD4847]
MDKALLEFQHRNRLRCRTSNAADTVDVGSPTNRDLSLKIECSKNTRKAKI